MHLLHTAATLTRTAADPDFKGDGGSSIPDLQKALGLQAISLQFYVCPGPLLCAQFQLTSDEETKMQLQNGTSVQPGCYTEPW